MKSREIAFDLAKALVMLCVIRWHLCRHGICHDPGPSVAGNLYVMAGMPLFFMISGYFAARHIDYKIRYFLATAVILIWPLFSFGVCFAIIETLFGVPAFDGWKEVLFPFYRISAGSWFLRTLANLFIIIGIIVNLPRKFRPVAFCLIYASMFFCGKVHGMWAGFIVNMGLYFGFGLFVLSAWPMYKNNCVGIICGLFYLIVGICAGDITTNGLSWYHAPSNWHIFCDLHQAIMFGLRLVLGMSGSVFILWALNSLLKVKRLANVVHLIASFGTTSLGIYVIHEWPMMFLRNFRDSRIPWCYSFLLAIAIFLASHFLTVLIRRNKTLSYFFFLDRKIVISWMDYIVGRVGRIINRV